MKDATYNDFELQPFEKRIDATFPFGCIL